MRNSHTCTRIPSGRAWWHIRATGPSVRHTTTSKGGAWACRFVGSPEKPPVPDGTPIAELSRPPAIFRKVFVGRTILPLAFSIPGRQVARNDKGV